LPWGCPVDELSPGAGCAGIGGMPGGGIGGSKTRAERELPKFCGGCGAELPDGGEEPGGIWFWPNGPAELFGA
jgi:hypothetical protein